MGVLAGNPSDVTEVSRSKSDRSSATPPPVHIRKLTLDDPWRWLAAGWRDMWAMPAISLGYGAIFSAVSLALVITVFVAELSSAVLALGAGFMLIGPMMAVGLYEASRRLEAGEEIRLKDVLIVATKSPAQLAFLGGALMLALLIWMRIASLLFALFFGIEGFPPLTDFLPTLMFTAHGLGLLVIGTATGALIAFCVFAISALSVPLLMVRDVDAVTAMLTSVKVVSENVRPMALWAWIIALVTAAGMVTFFLGMVVAFPLIGHATWHAFRGAIEEG